MGLREDLRKAILNRLKKNKSPLEGFFTSEEMEEAILAVLVSGRHLLLEGPPGIGKTTVAKIIARLLPPTKVVKGCRYVCAPDKPTCPAISLAVMRALSWSRPKISISLLSDIHKNIYIYHNKAKYI